MLTCWQASARTMNQRNWQKRRRNCGWGCTCCCAKAAQSATWPRWRRWSIRIMRQTARLLPMINWPGTLWRRGISTIACARLSAWACRPSPRCKSPRLIRRVITACVTSARLPRATAPTSSFSKTCKTLPFAEPTKKEFSLPRMENI